MPLRLEIQRRLTARSERVKSADLHPTEPWMVLSLYSGAVVVWNHETQAIVKSFELCDLPVRVTKFVARKHWIIAGADDMQIRVFNYNTLDKVCMFEAHCDYIRSVAVHPTQPFVLTSSDDMLIKLWDWDRKWTCCQVFEGHIQLCPIKAQCRRGRRRFYGFMCFLVLCRASDSRRWLCPLTPITSLSWLCSWVS
uniref:Uncharacterized protein n=1 Tax=Fundulus heteroclitus TaxID=8078 RepID=A0A3Q2PXK4_FUNHE